MKQINFSKTDPTYGEIEGIGRIDGKIYYLKFNSHEYSKMMIASLQQKGAVISPGRGWIRINMFGINKEVILNKERFNVDEKTPEEVENILFKFLGETYVQMGFIVETKELNSGGYGSVK